MQTPDTRLDDLITIKSFAQRYPDLATEPALRWQVFNADGNGLIEAGAVIRVGRKVLIDSPRYRDWLTAHRGISKQPRGPGNRVEAIAVAQEISGSIGDR